MYTQLQKPGSIPGLETIDLHETEVSSMAQGKQLSDQTRAAVMAALLTGQSVNKIAEEFEVSKSTVSALRKSLPKLNLEQPRTQKESDNPDDPNETLESLVLKYVATNLRTLEAQSKAVGDPDYIKNQPASELAVLHGVIADKTFRILSALEPARDPT